MLLNHVDGVLEVLVDVVVQGGLEDPQEIKRYKEKRTQNTMKSMTVVQLTILYAGLFPSLEAISVWRGRLGYASSGVER